MAETRKFQLVIQLPAASVADFDRLVQLEEALSKSLGGEIEIAGHEVGSGEGNVYVRTDAPESQLPKIVAAVGAARRDQVKIAYRRSEDDPFTIIWPPGARDFRIL